MEFGVKPLFEDVSFVVNDRDRIALVGKNGAGKSTMLKILCGLQKPTAGTVSVPSETTIGYLPQVMKLTDDTTVREEAYKAFSDITRLKERVDELNRQLEERTDYESEEYLDLVQRFTNAHDRYMMMGADNCDANLERTLTGLGFLQSDFDRPTSEFSGGWRMRIELAKILLQSPDVLLLDEPTNHLDIESIQWLEQFLSQSAKAVVLVSHDRAFINNVTNRTLEISCGKVVDYKVNYDQYVVLRKERREQQQRAYENQQKEIAEMKDFIERFRYKPTKAVQVQSRIKQLAKIVPPHTVIVNVGKGLDSKHGYCRLSETISNAMNGSNPVVALTGPTHAEEVARGIPTAIVAASESRAAAELTQAAFMNDTNFRVYTSSDIIGCELGGAFKNIIALGAGISDGLGLGDNSKAAFMTRGLTEIARLGVKLGAKQETFAGLSGVGDLIVTCCSMHSRNRRAGILIGKGATAQEAMKEVGATDVSDYEENTDRICLYYTDRNRKLQ